MEVFLVVVAVLGRFLLIWRRESLSGYFGPPGSEAGIFKYALGSPLVGVLGFTAQWGSALLLVAFGDFYAAGAALALAFLAARPLLRLVNSGAPVRTQGTQVHAPRVAKMATSSTGDPRAQATPTSATRAGGPRPHVPAVSEPRFKYGLGSLQGGVPTEVAIQIMLAACNKPDTMYTTERWITPRLAELRSGLSDPITEDQANALRDAVLQRCPLKDVLQWLAGEPTRWTDYQAKKRASEVAARRETAERVRRNWDWEKARRLQEAGHRVYIPPAVALKRKQGSHSEPASPKE